MRLLQAAVFASACILASGQGPRRVDNRAFAPGEYIHFVIRYGFVKAGSATMSVEQTEHKGRPCYLLKTTASSAPSFDWAYKVRDWTASYIDKERFHSLRFEKHLSEGSYKADVVVDFDQTHRRATFSEEEGKSRTFSIPENVLDALGALFFVRTQELKVGQEFTVPAADNTKTYQIKVIVHRMEEIEAAGKKRMCYVVEPVMADGSGIFKKNGRLTVWLTADPKKLPIKMDSKVFVGSIRCTADEIREGSPGN